MELYIILRNAKVLQVILKITKHARDKMSALAINADMIKVAIKRGSKFKKKDDKFLTVYSYFSVVYGIIGKDIYKIITLYENK